MSFRAYLNRLSPELMLQHRILTIALCLALALITTSCGGGNIGGAGSNARQGGEPSDAGFPRGPARQVFQTGFKHINELFVEPVAISQVALHGLQGLKTLDPDFVVDRTGDQLRVSVGPTYLAYKTPADNDIRGWAVLTVEALESGREMSPKLRAANSERLYQIVFETGLQDLDRFSHYSGRDQAREERAQRGGFGGIGVMLDSKVDGRVLSTIGDAPAQRVGVRAGDLIVSIDGTSVIGKTNAEIAPMLRGPIGTEVDVALQREAAAPLSVRIRRSKIVEESVRYRRELGNIAYFKVTTFNVETASTLINALTKARREMGGHMRGLILDLRDNRGGLLDQGIAVADMFLSRGRIMTAGGRHPESQRPYDAAGDDQSGGLPMIVLVNKNSASSAEIVAAALQDQRRAMVVGQRSYGKGSIQNVLPLPNEGDLHITWAKFYGPEGYSLDRLGVMPSVCIRADGPSPAKVLDDLRNGRIDPLATIKARRAAAELPLDQQKLYGETCPHLTAPRDEDLELDVARILLTEPALVQRSLRGSMLATRTSARQKEGNALLLPSNLDRPSPVSIVSPPSVNP
jgi:carboxyl-terminal processing protease